MAKLKEMTRVLVTFLSFAALTTLLQTAFGERSVKKGK